MENETKDNKTPVRPYKVDGIEECDNPLPKWWVGLFIVTILFGVGYVGYYHLLGMPDHLERFHMAMDKRAVENPSLENPRDGDNLAVRLSSADLIDAGREPFKTNCTPCHSANGEGGIGPNLTDEFWVHGGAPEDIIRVLENGVLEKGMPPWKDVLGRKKIEALTALILSWRGKNLAGKAAEGERYSP